MNAKELEGDLAAIEKTVTRSNADATTKRLLGEVIEWNRSLVKQLAAGGGAGDAKLAERVEVLETAVDDLLNDAEEGIYQETAQQIIAAFEQARQVNAVVAAWITGGKSGLDDVTAKKFAQLIKVSEAGIAAAITLVAEITIPDEAEDDEGPEDEDEDEDAELDEAAEDAAEGPEDEAEENA